MRSELAEHLLGRLMQWDREAFAERVRQLEALASHKWDEYGNYRPGVKFFESLAAWLHQFPTIEERAAALDFVLEHMVFISDAEMKHLIEIVYPDFMEPVLLRRTSEKTGISRRRVSQLVAHDEFRALRRRSLVLGASDGARLDRLRRSAPVLSHEQFLQSSEPPLDLISPMLEKLGVALEHHGLTAPATFGHVFMIDDFSGSGKTMLRVDSGQVKGKLKKLQDALGGLHTAGAVAEDVDVTVILYVASEQAKRHIDDHLASTDLPEWQLRVVHLIPEWMRVDLCAPVMAELSRTYYDDVLTDEHKDEVPLGFADCALPLIMSHNTPNNSISLLWADTTDEPGSHQRRALFPRYERHHQDRP